MGGVCPEVLLLGLVEDRWWLWCGFNIYDTCIATMECNPVCVGYTYHLHELGCMKTAGIYEHI